MALRDAFGFLSLPRAGWEASVQARSPHEAAQAVTSLQSSSSATDRAWSSSKVRLPSLEELLSTSSSNDASFMKQQQPVLKTLVRQGVPFRVRPTLWYLASGGYSQAQAAAPGSYAKLAASSAGLPELVIRQVDTDVRSVGLSWRPHPLFKQADAIQAMSSILVALLNHNTRLGYSRQLCHIVAFTLVVFGGPAKQEQVFWTLASLLQDKLFSYCGGQWLLGVRVEQEVLTKLTTRKLPRLSAHLNSMHLSPGTFVQPWLSCLFVTCLPPEVVARVWDCMMVEGCKVLLRTGLALLKMYDQTLSSCTFPEVLRKVLDLRVSRTTDAPLLLAAAFKGCGSLPGEQVEALRADAMRTITGPPPASAPVPTTKPRVSMGRTSSGAQLVPRSLFKGFSGSSSAASSYAAANGLHSPGGSSAGSPPGTADLQAADASDASAYARSYGSSAADVALTSNPASGGSSPGRPRDDGGSGGGGGHMPKRPSVGSQLTSMLSRLGFSQVGQAAADPAGGASAGSKMLRRSATTSSVQALAAC